MLRPALLAAALCAAALSLNTSARADAPVADGNWLISYTPRGAAFEQNFFIVKLETKGDKTTGTIVAPAKGITVKDVKVSGKELTITTSNGLMFSGVVGSDPKQVLGGFGNENVQFRGRMVPTDKDAIETPSSPLKGVPAPMTEATKLASAPQGLRFQAQREKDAEKKKELTAKADEAQKEADEKVPGLYREVVAKSADNPAAIDASLALLQTAAKAKVTPDEAKKLVGVITKQSAAYGSTYSKFVTVDAAELLVNTKGLEAVAVDALAPMVKALSDKDPAELQVKLLTPYQKALEKAGKTAEAKTVAGTLVKLETKLDEEYHAKVPPFKPTKFEGRKEKGANQVAVMELFTGAQCPPCVAADVAFDALAKSYKPTDVVLIQYHMHIPGPDPLTNSDDIARWDYYRETFPMDIRGTPSTLFNGKPAAGGGGGMANAEGKFGEYKGLIDPLLEKTTAVKMGGKATRTGDKIQIAVDVNGLESTDDLKLRLLVVEDVVKYVGGNKLRFHHHVVRSMPGGAAGVAVKDKSMKHTATADVAEIRKTLTAYLDDFVAKSGPFPNSNRPMDLNALKVIALVQNDKTREIVQAVQIEVEGKATGGGQ